MILWTVDVGNTRAKLAVHCASDASRPQRLAHSNSCETAEGRVSLRALADEHGAPERIAISSVAAPDRLAALTRWLAPFGDPVLDPPVGLANRTLRPDEVGPDRLYAARAALQIVGEPVIVIDVGTAITVDAVGVRDGTWAFLGGAIAPGARVAARALGELGARLHVVDPEPDAPALGRTTAEALSAGIVYGQRGTVRELSVAIAAEAGLQAAPLVVTGGGRRWLGAPWLASERWIDEPDLVGLGLVAALTEVPLPPDGPRWSRA